MKYPKALEELIEALGALPGVGPRSAERYAYFLYKEQSHKSHQLSDALMKLHQDIKTCPITGELIESDQQQSPIYTDSKRDKKVVCVVSDPFDVYAMEKTELFRGTYHVLGGLISPIDGIGPDDIAVPQLISRVESDAVAEVILATNATVEGETTALYLQQQLSGTGIKITRLARGLSVGVDLEYADRLSLSRALEGRVSV
jgi:recombination protein RecR